MLKSEIKLLFLNMLRRSRIAPTPSGYLHIGNALNFVLTWLWVRKEGGRLRLRIDDSDTTRSKPEYIEDIFRTLDWLKLDWDEGPQSPDEQEHVYSQALRAGRYEEVMRRLMATKLVFACECSRKDLPERNCNCRMKALSFNQYDTSLRIVTPLESIPVKDMVGGTQQVDLNNEMKNFVIRRRDGITAYQLCSVTDDIDHDINLVIRGNDLLSSTAAQQYLASLIGAGSFAATTFCHHPLMYDEYGNKLSKSAASLSLKTMRGQGMGVEQFYIRLSGLMGFAEPCISLQQMLSYEGSLFNMK